VIGASLMDFVLPDDHPKLRALLQLVAQKNCRGEIRLQPRRVSPMSVHLSLNPLLLNSTQAVCLIASDLSEMKRANPPQESWRATVVAIFSARMQHADHGARACSAENRSRPVPLH